MHKAKISGRYLSLNWRFLPCSSRPFRKLTSAWTRLSRLGNYGSRDVIASHVARLFCRQNIADSRRASDSNLTQERGFLPAMNGRVSSPSIRWTKPYMHFFSFCQRFVVPSIPLLKIQETTRLSPVRKNAWMLFHMQKDLCLVSNTAA